MRHSAASRRTTPARSGSRGPRSGLIGQFRIDAFDSQADGAAAGQRQFDHPGWIIFSIGDEFDRQQRNYGIGGAPLDVDGLNLGHAIEPQRRPHARAGAFHVFPAVAVDHGRETPLLRQPGEIFQLAHGILQSRRHDLQIFGIRGRQF